MAWKLCLVLMVMSSACSATGNRIGLSSFEARNYPALGVVASATDKSTGATIKGLKRGEFSVCIDGIDQAGASVESVLSGGKKIALALLVDTSGSMKGVPLDSAKQAIDGMLARLSTEDEASVIGFSGRVRGVSEFLTDRAKLRSETRSLRAGGQTAFCDAVVRACDSVSAQTCDRRVVVALTDGRDNASKLSYAQCVQRVEAAGVPVYVIGLGRDVAEDKLSELASASGGQYLAAASPSDLQSIYQSVAENLQNQYMVKLTAPDSLKPGTWHDLSVSARGAMSKVVFMVPLPGGSLAAAAEDSIWSSLPVALVIFGVLDVAALGAYAASRRKARSRG